MTKKDYELIAGVIDRVASHQRMFAREYASRYEKERLDNLKTASEECWQCFFTVQDVARKLAVELEYNDSKFDSDKFLKACGV